MTVTPITARTSTPTAGAPGGSRPANRSGASVTPATPRAARPICTSSSIHKGERRWIPTTRWWRGADQDAEAPGPPGRGDGDDPGPHRDEPGRPQRPAPGRPAGGELQAAVG